MAVRINKAKNFKGKAYVAADELDSLIQTMAFASTDTITSKNTADSWKITFTTEDGKTANTSAVDLTKIKDYIDNKSITVSEGDGIVINDEGANALNPIISTKIRLASADTTAGYAASYKLQVWDNTANSNAGDWKDAGNDSVLIDIVKDQFIKDAEFGWSTVNSNAGTGFVTGAKPSSGTYYPTLHIEVWTNTDGNTSSSSTNAGEGVTHIYVPLNDVFQDKTAGNGIDSTQLASNVIAVKIESTTDGYTLITTSGVAGVDLISATADGLKLANIQAAIDVAVDDEHAKMSTAVEAVDGRVDSLVNTTSNAVSALNGRINTVANNTSTAISGLEDEIVALDSKVDDAFADADTKIENAVDSAVAVGSAALVATVATINTNVSAVASGLNDRIVAVAGNAQTGIQTVGAAVDDLDTKVDGVFSNLDTAINNAIDAVESNITSHTANAVQILSTSAVMSSAVETDGVTRTATINNALHIIGVFDENGIQVYPEITKGDGSYTLEADFVSSAATETWTVYYTQALTTLKTAGAVATDYETAAAAVAGTTVGNGTSASYTSATATAPADVTVADITYADEKTSTSRTIASGDAATIPSAGEAVTVGALTYDTVNA